MGCKVDIPLCKVRLTSCDLNTPTSVATTNWRPPNCRVRLRRRLDAQDRGRAIVVRRPSDARSSRRESPAGLGGSAVVFRRVHPDRGTFGGTPPGLVAVLQDDIPDHHSFANPCRSLQYGLAKRWIAGILFQSCRFRGHVVRKCGSQQRRSAMSSLVVVVGVVRDSLAKTRRLANPHDAVTLREHVETRDVGNSLAVARRYRLRFRQ